VNFQLRWTEQATQQLQAIAEYISVSSPVYAEQIIERIVARLRQALAHPESGRRVAEAPGAEIRELVEPPYRLLYRMRYETVEVVAILHGHQDLPSHLPRP
jgi:addiction module RelE/StbE family toxin